MTTLRNSPSESSPDKANYPSEPVNGEVQRHAGLVQVQVVVEGSTPLLMNAMSQEQLLKIWFKEKSPKTATRRQPREEAESKLHRLPDGTPHVPTKCLYATFINAGQFMRLDGKRQISTADKTILPSMLSLIDATLPLSAPHKDEYATWEVDIQQGRNPNGGEAVCIIRPRFDQWSLSFTVEVDQSLMSVPMARELIDIAGRRVGLLEYSPRHKGCFGCFLVTSWKQVKKS
jgi:hypothetical protein